MNLTELDAVLFDFGGTLVDQNFFRNGTAQVPDFPEIMKRNFYEPFFSNPDAPSLLGQWIAGEITKHDVAQAISLQTNYSKEHVLRAMEENCRKLKVFNSIFEWAKKISRIKRTAIVTINSDIFTDVIVDAYSLEAYFPVIVSSCHHKTLDKMLVCRKALEQLGNVKFERTLLIDDSKRCCSDFVKAGGKAYLFENEEKFSIDLLAT